MAEHIAVKNFREYLRIPTVQPNVNYDSCVEFLKKMAKSLDLPCKVYEPVRNKPIVVITWVGTNPNQPTLLLNSHMDVVPVFREKWTHDPFGAEKDANGNIYARGAQDMKCVGIQYIEAIRRLKEKGVKLNRTIHMSFVPDEEIGGEDGMGAWSQTEDFKELNVGCALDEGMASPDETYGGVQNNVVPPELVVGFDCRLPPSTDLEEFDKFINDTCKAAGKGVYPEFQQKQTASDITKLDNSNPWWVTFKDVTDGLGMKMKHAIFPGGTDSRFVRMVNIRLMGIPAFGFSPMNKTPVLLHDHDEFLSESTFLTGLDIYVKLIPALANS
ncbi:unnamed protein product [Nesidiocoris tenuis]|uniref:Peptidase M20 dimerisation domain-containing protein n=1 Tax=Nesidiocoris tenuis TaxID=355587 RepID=A0A6H5HFL1_9HEMI|nr:unnamed protein product [Nesidiocoris tenuis]